MKIRSIASLICFTLTIISTLGFVTDEFGLQWKWTCDTTTELCQREMSNEIVQNPQILRYNSLAVCRLVCGKYGALWPKPTITTIVSQELIHFHPNGINYQILNAFNGATDYLIQNTNIFRDNILSLCNGNCSYPSGTETFVILSIGSSDLTLNWETNETYSLDITTTDHKITVRISAENVYGVRHGLETLTQLVASYPSVDRYGKYSLQNLVMVTGATIRDKPIYKHRGLLLDTSRNYLPISAIKKQIDGMAASKLNILHWHATDTQSFPLQFPKVPQLSRYGSYDAKHIYKPEDIQDLLKYAKLRGIRIILEIDAPAHAGNGWQWGKDAGIGDLAVCVNQNPWRQYCIQPPCGQLNPVNSHLYNVLRDLYSDIINIFPKNEIFHMGGDEVFFPCWNSSEEIVKYLERNGKGRQNDDFLQLWADYQAASLNVFDSEVGNNLTPIILWSSGLTDPKVINKYLSKYRYVIETWVPKDNPLPQELLNMGYKLIISTKDAWYLDHGFWGNTQYYTWRTAYNNLLPRHDGVLGGEVCMWGELVDEHNLDARIWPRAAAAAERLWSNPTTNTASAEPRMYIHRERLVSRGIQVEGLAPRWCFQNEGQCL